MKISRFQSYLHENLFHIEDQISREIWMVRPSLFGSNPETLSTNAFQDGSGGLPDPINQARAEFDAAVFKMERAGLKLVVFDQAENNPSPDALFPNNWFSVHADKVILYPMLSSLRRKEVNPAMVKTLEQRGKKRIDLRSLEGSGAYLEGTGSLVLDRIGKRAYAALSQRTNMEALKHWSSITGFEVLAFETSDASGMPIYHTNVIMSLGKKLAWVCDAVIPDLAQRKRVLDGLSEHRKSVKISEAQMREFCGNVLEVKNQEGTSILLVSERAWAAFSSDQKQVMERELQPLVLSIPTIERVGGGGIRCMVAEIF